MGLITTLVALTKAALGTKGNAPGQSVIAQAEGFAGQVMTPEVYQAPGVFAVPPDGVRGVYIPVGNAGRYGIVIALQNYQITVDVGGPGGSALVSTTADGKTVKAKIVLDPEGNATHTAEGNEVHEAAEIHLNGDGKRLVTWDELNTALQNHTHAAGTLVAPNGPVSGATGAPIALDISGAKTTTIKTGG